MFRSVKLLDRLRALGELSTFRHLIAALAANLATEPTQRDALSSHGLLALAAELSPADAAVYADHKGGGSNAGAYANHKGGSSNSGAYADHRGGSSNTGAYAESSSSGPHHISGGPQSRGVNPQGKASGASGEAAQTSRRLPPAVQSALDAHQQRGRNTGGADRGWGCGVGMGGNVAGMSGGGNAWAAAHSNGAGRSTQQGHGGGSEEEGGEEEEGEEEEEEGEEEEGEDDEGEEEEGEEEGEEMDDGEEEDGQEGEEGDAPQYQQQYSQQYAQQGGLRQAQPHDAGFLALQQAMMATSTPQENGAGDCPQQ